MRRSPIGSEARPFQVRFHVGIIRYEVAGIAMQELHEKLPVDHARDFVLHQRVCNARRAPATRKAPQCRSSVNHHIRSELNIAPNTDWRPG